MKKRSTFAVLIPFVFSQFAFASTVPEAEPTADTAEAEQQAYEAWARNFVDSLDMQTGQIQLPNSVATLNVPESFYYLSPADTERVLVEAWGNPSEGLIQGMLFPAHVTPLDPEAWGVTIDFDEDGYVSDDDAADMNYDDLLAQMQAETLEVNPDRVAAGYPAIELMGWAASPHYDAGRRQLYWAQELKFGDDPAHILNYNIRALGRRGVLVMNFIADMQQLPEIERNLDTVLGMTEFDPGHRYEEFDPDVDQVAAYGIGALVAGKVAAKAGFFAAALIFLKKFGVVILAGVAALGGRLLKRKKAA